MENFIDLLTNNPLWILYAFLLILFLSLYGIYRSKSNNTTNQQERESHALYASIFMWCAIIVLISPLFPYMPHGLGMLLLAFK
jgi:cell division protein FtsW (lipid II flippase)